MRRYAVPFLIPLVLTGLLLLGTVRPHAAPPDASAAGLASVETTAAASPQLVARALTVRRHTLAAWREWRRAKHCLGEPARICVGGRPPRAASAAVWLAAAEHWRAQRRDLVARLGRLVDRMRHPGGSSNGVRWLPLARWVGWPRYALHNLAWLIKNESSGRERAVSATNDHGLVQFNAPSWAGTWGRRMRCSFFPHVYDPELNLRFALYVFKVVQHGSFLPAWWGDPAATW